MLKMKKLPFAIVMATTLVSCANIDDSYQASQADYQNMKKSRNSLM
ncbi:outer membrane efflux protein [Rodentibacter pneumotropicus]|uniref:Outer membrane efflux protein n=1 Tax=Rodentibacter pneumotropicus TaxID=758 RepID=A0A3S4U0A6_9PAST|nr:outer membrane efflux protein [Rodentibacter pneumotropicus]